MRQYKFVLTNCIPSPTHQHCLAQSDQIDSQSDQIDAVALGSPLGPVLANIFMCHFEEKWVLNNNARPSVWFRYVDDTFTLFDNKNTAAQFLHYTQISNSPLSSKRTVQSLSWIFSSNDTITLSQHPFTERRPLPACPQNAGDSFTPIGVRAPSNLGGGGGAVTLLPEKITQCPKGWGLKSGCKRRCLSFSHLIKLLSLEK